MKTALLLHGMPSKEEYYNQSIPCGSNCHWFPWLQKELIVKDYQVWAPDILHSFMPNYATWKEEIERYSINEESLLVGHSCGGGFFLRWLSENKLKVKKLVLVAPWLDPSKQVCPEFFAFDFDKSLPSRLELTVFYSDNDHEEIMKSVELIKSTFPNVRYKEFSGYGHFCSSDMSSNEFPELLSELEIG